MDVWSVQPMETRSLFVDERADLLAVLEALGADGWTLASPAPGWTVKDVALHLLDGDLSRLSRGRDGDSTGVLPKAKGGDAATFAERLAVNNQRWIDATRQLSGRVIRDLLAYSSAQLDRWTADADLLVPSTVSWASDKSVQAWLDLARELTETWVHHQQIRAAIGLPTNTSRLPTVLRTFVCALPHQYRVRAEPGTTLLIDLDAGGCWRLVAQGADRWTLDEGAVAAPNASVAFTSDGAWRSFTGATLPPNGVSQSGPEALTEPVLTVRGIIA